MLDHSEPGSWREAFLYPPFAGAMTADGEFRRGFPNLFNDPRCDAPDGLGAVGSRSFLAPGDRP